MYVLIMNKTHKCCSIKIKYYERINILNKPLNKSIIPTKLNAPCLPLRCLIIHCILFVFFCKKKYPPGHFFMVRQNKVPHRSTVKVVDLNILLLSPSCARVCLLLRSCRCLYTHAHANLLMRSILRKETDSRALSRGLVGWGAKEGPTS